MAKEKCPYCKEPYDPEEDCGTFGCANKNCDRVICENCASSGKCPPCDGTILIVFKNPRRRRSA